MNTEDKKEAGRPKKDITKRTITKTCSVTPEHLAIVTDHYGSITNLVKVIAESLKSINK